MLESVRLLLVEDELQFPPESDPFLTALVEAGFQVTVATTGDDVLRELRQQVFDCIILDIMLPRPTQGPLATGPDKELGLELIKMIRHDPEYEHCADTSIVVVTAVADFADLDDLMQNEANLKYLAKPFSPDHLVRLVQDTLGLANRQGAPDPHK